MFLNSSSLDGIVMVKVGVDFLSVTSTSLSEFDEEFKLDILTWGSGVLSVVIRINGFP